MKRWAVGFFSMYDNVLTVEIINSPTWQEAVKAHTKIGEMEFDQNDLETAQEDFFNSDSGMDVVEIT